MRLVANWRDVLRRAWSIRLMLIAALLSGLEVALPLFGDMLPIPTGALAALSFIITAGAFAARLIAQQGLSDD